MGVSGMSAWTPVERMVPFSAGQGTLAEMIGGFTFATPLISRDTPGGWTGVNTE